MPSPESAETLNSRHTVQSPSKDRLFIWERPADSSPQYSLTRWVNWVPTIALVLASLVFLGATSIRALALDEAATLGFARADFYDFAEVVLRSYDAVHATYYLVIRPIADASINSIRLISGVAMALTTYLAMKIAARLSGRRAAVATGLALPAIPLAVEAAATARSFALACLFVTWSWWLLVRMVTDKDVSWILRLSYIVVTALSMVIFAMSILSLIAQALMVTLAGRGGTSRMSLYLYQVASLIPALPIFALAYLQRDQLAGVETLTLGSMLQIPTYFFGQGFHFGISSAANWVSWTFAGIATLFAITGIVRAKPASSVSPTTNLLVMTWLLTPLLVVGLASIISPLLAPRYLVILTPALALAIGQGVAQLKNVVTLVLSLLAWIAAIALIFGQLLRPEGVDAWGAKYRILEQGVLSQDAVIFAPDLYGVMAQQSGLRLPRVIEQSSLLASDWKGSELRGVDRIWVVPYVDSDLRTGSSRWLPAALRDAGWHECPPLRTSSGSILVFSRAQSECP